MTEPRLFPQPLLRGQRRDYDIDFLISSSIINVEPTAPKERQLLCWVLPPWQRAEVWTVGQKQRFIEGIFLGLGTGYYVFNQLDWDNDGACRPRSGWLIDGQQRLTAIRDFVAGNIVIFDQWGYPDLDAKVQTTRFKRVVFPSVEIEYQSDEHHLRELYDRLNFGGTAHSAADRERFAAHAPADAGEPVATEVQDRPTWR